MSESHSTTPTKPSKPYEEFPLFAHANGQWAKKIGGKTSFFGPWADPDGPRAKYDAQTDTLHARKKLRPDQVASTVVDLCNLLGEHKEAAVDQGDAKWGPHRLAKTILCIRSIFRYAYDAEHIDRPVGFGPGFNSSAIAAEPGE